MGVSIYRNVNRSQCWAGTSHSVCARAGALAGGGVTCLLLSLAREISFKAKLAERWIVRGAKGRVIYPTQETNLRFSCTVSVVSDRPRV